MHTRRETPAQLSRNLASSCYQVSYATLPIGVSYSIDGTVDDGDAVKNQRSYQRLFARPGRLSGRAGTW